MKRIVSCVLFVLATHLGMAQDIFNKAKAALNARDTAAAVAAFHDAVKAGQKTGEADYYLGAIAFAQGKIDDAIVFLEASIKLDDENVDALRILAAASMVKKDIAAALVYYRRAAKLAPKNPDVAAGFGHALLAADSIDAAIINLTRAKEFASENPAVYVALGDAYSKQGVIVLGIDNYKKAIELEPKNITTHLKLARSYMKNRQYNEAVKAYDAAIAVDSTVADDYLEPGKILVLAKQYKRAVPYLRKYVALRPKSSEGMTLFTAALFGAEDFAEVVKVGPNALLLDSANVETWRTYAHSLVETKDYKTALTAFAALQRRNAIKSEDQSKLGKAYFGMNLYDDALKAYELAMLADSTNCDPFFDLGFLYMRQQNYAKAATMFEKKIACDPRSLSAYINAGSSLMQVGDLPRARELFFKAIELKKDFLQGRLWLARYYVQVDSFDLAEEQYLEVVKLIGDQIDKNKGVYGEAHKLLGSLYMTKRMYLKAIDAFRKTQTVGTDDSNVHLSWGQAILQTLDPKEPAEESKKKNDDAVKHFHRCVELDAKNENGHLWLAEGLVRSRIPGEDEANRKLKEEACDEYRKALRLNPKNKDAEKGMERIGCQ
jgi:tetratricopeptide (TPR) repeat protein